MTGKVRSKIEEKGYGFITVDGKDYFFHISQCLTPFADIREGDIVEFNIEQSPKGKRAVDVEVVL